MRGSFWLCASFTGVVSKWILAPVQASKLVEIQSFKRAVYSIDALEIYTSGPARAP